MSAERLVSHLEKLLASKGLSARKACMKAHEINPSVGIDFIRDMKRRGHVPRSDKLMALAQALEVPASELLDLVDQGAPAKSGVEIYHDLGRVPLVGKVQAGLWQSDFLTDEFYASEFVSAPPDGRFPGLPRVAFKVIGDSMDRLYPEGTVILAIRFFDLARAPKTGEKVIVIRQSDGFDEATVKEIEILEDGRIALWPRSTNPEHSAAIIAPNLDSVFPDDGCHPDIRIEALVTQSIRIE